VGGDLFIAASLAPEDRHGRQGERQPMMKYIELPLCRKLKGNLVNAAARSRSNV
jgi:hypothetical protein